MKPFITRTEGFFAHVLRTAMEDLGLALGDLMPRSP